MAAASTDRVTTTEQRFPTEFVYFDIKDKPFARALTARLGELSGGQAQRVAIARAQVADPHVVFADEPTGALDSATSASVLGALLDSTVGRGRTLVMVTHDQATADRCSRLVRVQDGRIVADSAAATTGGVR